MKREHLPDERCGLNHKAVISEQRIYITTGEYEDGRLGEVSIKIDKEGSEMRLMRAVCRFMTIGIQHGIPMETYTGEMKYQQLGTRGVTDDAEVPMVKSIMDYLGKWLELKYPRGARKK